MNNYDKLIEYINENIIFTTSFQVDDKENIHYYKYYATLNFNNKVFSVNTVSCNKLIDYQISLKKDIINKIILNLGLDKLNGIKI